MFLNSYYYQAYIDAFTFDPAIFQNTPQFRYDEPSYAQFSQKYHDSDWLKRKITALPRAVWSALVESIYHLVTGAIIGLVRYPNDGGRFIKARLFSVPRDFQEAFGRLISLFHDKLGLFSIQKAQFYQSCYECFYSKIERMAAPRLTLDLEEMVDKALAFANGDIELFSYIREVLINREFLDNPRHYLSDWDERRGTTEEYRPIEDPARRFFREYLRPT